VIVFGKTDGITLKSSILQYPVQERPTGQNNVYPDVMRKDVEISTICTEIKGD
jgi:hypothetical protein